MFFAKLQCQRSTIIFLAGIKYSMRYLICDTEHHTQRCVMDHTAKCNCCQRYFLSSVASAVREIHP